MAQNKYVFAEHLIYETIFKYVETGTTPPEIADLMFDHFRLEVSLHDVPQNMVKKMYELLAKQAWYVRYKKHYIGV